MSQTPMHADHELAYLNIVTFNTAKRQGLAYIDDPDSMDMCEFWVEDYCNGDPEIPQCMDVSANFISADVNTKLHSKSEAKLEKLVQVPFLLHRCNVLWPDIPTNRLTFTLPAAAIGFYTYTCAVFFPCSKHLTDNILRHA